MKRRSFLTALGSLIALPFAGKTAIPDDLLDCCDDCERDDDWVYHKVECSCPPEMECDCGDDEESSDWNQESKVEWHRHCDQRKTCPRYNPWRRECHGEVPCVLAHPKCDPIKKQRG